MLTARHDLAIEFHGDAFAGKIEFNQQLRNAQRR
jgi:hypothetical protein